MEEKLAHAVQLRMQKQADPLSAGAAVAGLATIIGTALSGAGDIARAGAHVAGKVMDYAVPIAVVAPALAGVTAAAMHSKLTSPSKTKAETLQKEMHVAELDQMLADIKARRQNRLKQSMESTGGSERSLHI